MNDQGVANQGGSKRKYVRLKATNDPDETRADILAVAQEQFARHGYAGTTIDSIAAKTKRSKRMIYYYFSSKPKLYKAVLENAYRGIRVAEASIRLDEDDPRQSIKNLVEFCFDYHFERPSFVKMVMGENLNDARFVSASDEIKNLHFPLTQRIEKCLRKGYENGFFGRTCTAVEMHMTITALSFFNVSNQATFSAIFDIDMRSPAVCRARKQEILLAVLGRLDTKLDDGFSTEYR